jgi:formylglycine-generating enzyme required for sulfatase activity
MRDKKPFYSIAIVMLVLAGSACAADLIVPAGSIVTKSTAGSFGQFMVAGRLTVEQGADLTFTSESHVDGVETSGIRPEIIMNGGSFFVDARTNTGTNKVDNGGNYAYLTMNGGTFTTTDTFKFPDDAGGEHRIHLNGGIMHCGDIQQIHERDAIIYVGGGILRLDDITGGERDPHEWKANGDLLPAEGYDDVVIEYIPAGPYTEVRALISDPNVASNPSPPDWQAVFDTELTLTWTPGENAAKHDVYFGTDFDDVNTATDPNALPGRGRQDSNTYDVCDLEVAATYYWRIDEVNGPGTSTGKVWRFTVVDAYVNSIGMELVRLVPGTFTMGSGGADPDEEPVHQVTITNSFYLSVTEVTNAQYEQFDPNHIAYRAPQTYNGQTVHMSDGDDEAVIYVSWEDANNFCQWLSNLEGESYRLPTEAEWEYACRAGTTTPYYTGGSLPPSYYKNQQNSSWPDDVDLTVRTTGQNSWGLWDMHGNVEEWCYDWYGPYESGSQTDPVGRANGDFRVSRGGSHNTPVFYLRSANRLSSLPQDKHWLIGFRVVCGEMPGTPALPEPAPKLWATGVSQTTYAWPSEHETPTPFFIGPDVWVREPAWADEIPMYGHNHQPGVTFCDNGDLLGAWYSCESERGRELTVLASRLRQGNSTWDYPDEFFRAQDRNMHGTALFNDRSGKLYLFNGLGTDYSWEKLALCTATSTDNGVTWQPRIINPYHGKHHQVVAGPIKTRERYIIVSGDANPGSAIHISRDDGRTFVDPGANRPEPSFADGTTGAWIAGIHCGFVQLLNGDLLAFGRSNDINGYMPRSLSTDMGENWTYSASLFQPIGGGQRCVLLRLEYSYGERLGGTVDGPILMLSFGSGTMLNGEHQLEGCSGMFAAISYDECQTWTDKKLISNLQGSDSVFLDGGGNTGWFTMSRTEAEPRGYLSATQSPDGVIHVCSSRLYYAFNLAWIDPAFTPKPQLLKADLYPDGIIDWADLRVFVQQWTDECPVYDWCAGRDINRDTMVDGFDFATLASYWLQSYP